MTNISKEELQKHMFQALRKEREWQGSAEKAQADAIYAMRRGLMADIAYKPFTLDQLERIREITHEEE